MARKKFSTIVRELKKAGPGKRVLEPVPGARGLFVRITDTGAKSFTIIARRKSDGKQKWAAVPAAVDLDSLTDDDLDRVRALAREGITRIERGDVAFPPPPAAPDSLCTIGDSFMKRHVRKNKLLTGNKIEQTLGRLVYPALGKRPVDEIRRRDIVELMDRIEDENGTVMADRTLEILRSMFNWHERRDDDFISPIRRGMTRTKSSERRRERVLSDQEIRLLWPICGESGVFGGLVQLLLLTAQRLAVVQHMRWEDIDRDGLWTIPVADRREKANARTLPLPKLAVEIIERQPRVVGNGFVFASSRTARYFDSLSRAKRTLDGRLLAALKAENGNKAELQPWVLHSLRHTAKTLMSRPRVAEFDSERALGHVIGGVSGIYSHHDFERERGAALETLATEIGRIINPPSDDKVVRLGRAASR